MNTSCISQDLSGTYKVINTSVDVLLTLEKRSNSNYTGSLSGNGNSFALQGKFENNYLSGTIQYDTEIYLFEAMPYGEFLSFTMAATDENQQPIAATVQTLNLQRVQPGATGQIQDSRYDEQSTAQEKILINGRALSTDEVNTLKEQYGVEPLAGNYWYDANCGLYGAVGYAAYGFMLPGHDFGPLDRNASHGNTKVLINGRELNQAEYLIWSSVLGSWIQAGSYWLDDQGNAGYAGSNEVLVNLYTAAQNNPYSGSGDSGDNFWMTKFSAGNYDQGNSRGYVSVPGYGPVGYGF
jgi:hypothetical protein